jgi:hypothetical protein
LSEISEEENKRDPESKKIKIRRNQLRRGVDDGVG